MIRGMTGFGYAQVSSGKIKATIEIKSLNHRYLDINFYLPPGFASLENKIQQILKKNLSRGRVTVSIKFTQKADAHVSLNKNMAKEYLRHIRTLKNELTLKGEVDISDIIRQPGVFEVKDSQVTPEAMWKALEKGLKEAMAGLVNMRKREGRSLHADISGQLRRMSMRISKIQARIKILLRDNKKRLTSEEFASFQKGGDINEEISRFKHYVDEIKALLKTNVSSGKKIDFIAQEMQREVNTMGAKLQDKIISNAVIALKSKIEKIREQSQNVE